MSRRSRPGLSRHRVLHAGLELVDREGMASLTMRRLGKELGVEAMSLYTYVSSKQDLLDGVLECIYQEVPKVVAVDGPWQERLREAARGFREVLLRHPNAVGLMAARPVRNEASLSLMESLLEELHSAGLSIEQADRVLTVLVSFTIGHAAAEVGDAIERPVDDLGDPEAPVDGDRFPHVAARAGLDTTDRNAEYALGLDYIVDGVQRTVGGLVAAGTCT